MRPCYVIYSVARPRSSTAKLATVMFHEEAAHAYAKQIRDQMGWHGVIVKAFGPDEQASDSVEVVPSEVDVRA